MSERKIEEFLLREQVMEVLLVFKEVKSNAISSLLQVLVENRPSQAIEWRKHDWITRA